MKKTTFKKKVHSLLRENDEDLEEVVALTLTLTLTRTNQKYFHKIDIGLRITLAFPHQIIPYFNTYNTYTFSIKDDNFLLNKCYI